MLAALFVSPQEAANLNIHPIEFKEMSAAELASAMSKIDITEGRRSFYSLAQHAVILSYLIEDTKTSLMALGLPFLGDSMRSFGSVNSALKALTGSDEQPTQEQLQTISSLHQRLRHNVSRDVMETDAYCPDEAIADVHINPMHAQSAFAWHVERRGQLVRALM